MQFGLKRSKIDECVYFRVDGNNILVLAIYVDDILIFSNDVEMKTALKKNLHEKFQMKDIGTAKYILGIEIIRVTKVDTFVKC